MNQLPHETGLPLRRLGKSGLDSLPSHLLDHLEFRVVSGHGQWLDTVYQMLADQFAPDVLDPLERYVGWLELNKAKTNKFPYLLMAAYCSVQGRAIPLGAISGNIMKVEEYVGPNPGKQENPYIFAIGHQVTDDALRKGGVKGVGTRLWKSAMHEANARIKTLGGRFCYSVLEAENASIGFWSKLGYRWPKDVHYWQPPLEFDSTGRYKHPEIPETLMLDPVEAALENKIKKGLLQNIIATLYLNWSLDKYRNTLSAPAMEKAEDYVMGKLFGKVCAEMTGADPIPLVPYWSDKQP